MTTFLIGIFVGTLLGLYGGNAKFRGMVNEGAYRVRFFMMPENRRERKLRKQWGKRGDL